MRDQFCSHCGTALPQTGYPRRCSNGTCNVEIWANPIPVSVVLVPVVHEERTGLLVIRRGIEPQRGKLCLTGGFLEEHESWQQGGAREVREEAGLELDPTSLTPLWFTSSAPRPNRVLLFSVAPAVLASALPPCPSTVETLERGLLFGPEGLDEVCAFSLHAEAMRRFFHTRGQGGPVDFRAV
jgi:ADP-ribose pyrophosphatase YjhB (NUDIX family)